VYTQTFNAVETALFGGLLISYLFSTFYYLPLSIFIAFAVVLCISGILLQIHSYKKREHDRRIMTGEEST
jgi:cytochrome c biogenesis protein ResB